MPVLTSEIMDNSAALMNDVAKTQYTYAAQLPYLKIAMDELQEEFELNNIPISNETSAAIIIPIGTVQLGFVTIPALPSDLIEIQQLWERLSGSSDPFVPMTKQEFLPHYLDNIQVDSLVYWNWKNQIINFLGATTIRDVKIDYIGSFFPTLVDSTTSLDLINAKSFLEYRTGALCAEYIAENPTRAISLNGKADLAMARALGIPTKGRQSIPYRRRPFMAAYRRRQNW